LLKQAAYNFLRTIPNKRKKDMSRTEKKADVIATPAAGNGNTGPGSASITHEDIAMRAYEIYQQRGVNPGSELDDWLEAERQLSTSNNSAS
jgi:hypothetical protein